MRTVIIDGHTLNPGDLSWSDLEALTPVTYYPRSAPAEVAARIGDAEIVLTNKVPISAEVIKACPKLKYIGVTATGYNIIDTAAAKEAGVTVTNVPGYSTNSVAQLVFALLLEYTHHIGHHSDRVRAGGWAKSPDFSFWDFPLVELAGLHLGIVGFGQTGQAVGRIAHAFGMNVLVHSRSKPAFDDYPIRVLPFEEILAESDVITLHCPLTPATKHLISWPQLQAMKRTAVLINTARGPLVNEADLARALQEKIIAYALLDVLSAEPPPADNPLPSAPNSIIVPHIAWASFAARRRLMRQIVENLRGFLQGKPHNVVG